MLDSFEINNFRLFQHLKVEKLGRVNLIVGQNNSGKSTFLEAVELYASNADSTVFLSLLQSRQEIWISEAELYSKNFLGNPLRHLFFGHKLPRIGESGISLGEVSSNIKLQISAAAYQNKNDDDGTIRKIRIYGSKLDEDLSDVEVFLVAEDGERTRRLFSLNIGAKDIRRNQRILYGRQEPDFKYTWQMVSTENMPNQKLAALWDLTNLNLQLKSEVISALNVIDDRISGVGFVEDVNQMQDRNRIPLVTITGIDEPLPLKSMGDGMTRLFHIIVALVNARNGLLLIDEFENGLHWTVQPKVWDIIFQLSEKLNVQVFATTHSRDCIKGFDHAWNNYPKLGAFFRLDAKGELIKATEYTSETLSDSIDMDVEVR